MKILIDSREQKKLSFKCSNEISCLNFGDYSCELKDGYVIPIVFERKNLSDLFGSLSKGYNRFRKCFERSNEAGFKMVIAIEGTKERILKGYSHSQRNGCSIVLQLETIKERYGIDHIYFKSRIGMANYIEHFFLEYEKEYQDRIKSGKEANEQTENGRTSEGNEGA